MILGLLTMSAAALFTPRKRGLLASLAGTFRGLMDARSNDHVPPAAAPASPPKDTSAGPAYEDADVLIGRTLLVAQKHADDLERAAQARADEIVAGAEATAGDLLQSARDEASQILTQARDGADAIRESARQQASEWLTLLKDHADRLVLTAHTAFQQAQRSVEERVKSFPLELERYAADWAVSVPGGGPEASGPWTREHPAAIARSAGELARSIGLTDGTATTFAAEVAVTPPSQDGHD